MQTNLALKISQLRRQADLLSILDEPDKLSVVEPANKALRSYDFELMRRRMREIRSLQQDIIYLSSQFSDGGDKALGAQVYELARFLDVIFNKLLTRATEYERLQIRKLVAQEAKTTGLPANMTEEQRAADIWADREANRDA